jgi:hypothetical protein
MTAEVTLDTQDPAKTPEDSLKGSKGLGSFGRLGANLPGCLKISARKKKLWLQMVGEGAPIMVSVVGGLRLGRSRKLYLNMPMQSMGRVTLLI